MMVKREITRLREQIDQMNLNLLDLINKRAELVQQIDDMKRFNPDRNQDMLNKVINHHQGPLDTETIEYLFKEIFKTDLPPLKQAHDQALLVSREKKPEDTIIEVNGEKIGNGHYHYIMGPCSVESFEQVDAVAQVLKKNGLKFLRGGAFKPRTSPYDFQGLGVEGLKILKQVANKYDLATVSEIVNPAHMELAVEHLDVIQIGARNMQNFELLKAAGEVDVPILLKRGMSATVAEFMNAAEYIISRGNGNIILCERGIRTFEQATRNTLDISSVPILKQETHLPVIVDVTHSTGRRDLLIPTAKAALAIGADGIMAEVHPDPVFALSDSAQQMDFPMFETFLKALEHQTTAFMPR